MKIVHHWRLIIILLLALWAVFLIHPYLKEGAIVSHVEVPASGKIKTGDFIGLLNGNKISNAADFDRIVSTIMPNDTVEVTILRETFPYSYKTISHVFIAGEYNNKTNVGIIVRDSQDSNLKLSHELIGGNKFTISSSNPAADAKVLAKRLKVGQVADYQISTDKNNVYIFSSHGNEIEKLISTTGSFEAKIGDKVFFTNADIKQMCLSGVECTLDTYQRYAESTEETATKEVVWRYDFETRISEEAGQRFVDLTKDLSIGSCTGDVCYLNETIDYYIDGVLLGSEKISTTLKGEPYTTPLVGGDVHTINVVDARDTRYFVQAIMQGKLYGTYGGMEKIEPSLKIPYQMITVFVLVILAVNSAIVFARVKNPITALFAFVLPGLEILTVTGIIAGLNIIITPITFAAIIAVPVISMVLQQIIVHKGRKEHFIRKKMDELSKKLDWYLFIALVVFFVLDLVYAKLFAPILLYVLILLTLTKTTFIRNIKTKEY